MRSKEIVKKSKSGRKRRRCDKNDEEQEVLNTPKMDWDVGDQMNNICNCAVLSNIHFDWDIRIDKVTN